MKTKELINLLKEEDPSGELEVVVGNTPIYTVNQLPAYWDGRLQILIRDKSKLPYYNIVGGKFTDRGHKVSIGTMSIDDIIYDNPEIPIEFEGETDYTSIKEWVEETRQKAREIYKEIEENKLNCV